MPILDHYPPRNSNTINPANPNPRRVSFHLDPLSLHSLHASPAPFESPRIVPDHQTCSNPSSGPATRHTPRSLLAEVPKRFLSSSPGPVRPNSLPPPPKNPDPASAKPRPLSMSASELAARHRAALHRFQQPSNKPLPSPSSPSPLSKSFSFNQTRENKQVLSSPKPTPKNHMPSPINPTHQDRSRSSSAYVQSLTLVDSGKLLIKKKNLNQAERAFLNTLPPLPPNKPFMTNNISSSSSGSKKKQKKHDDISTKININKSSSSHHDPYSWFDY